MELSDLKGRKPLATVALEDKIDVARTLVRLKKRIEARHELNVVEQQIIDRHEADLADGRVRGIDIEGLLPGVMKELGSGS